MLPALLHDRLDELGIDVAVCYPTYGLTVMGLDDPHVRVAAAARVQHVLRAGVRAASAIGSSPSRSCRPTRPTRPSRCSTTRSRRSDCAPSCAPVSCTVRCRARTSPAAPVGSTRSVSTARTTTTRCGAASSSSTSPPPSTPPAWVGAAARRRRATSRTTSARSAPPAKRCAARWCSAACMHRFPELRFAFLEGGVTWAATLCSDLVGHLEKRHGDAIGQLRPGAARSCRSSRTLIEQYGTRRGPGARRRPRRRAAHAERARRRPGTRSTSSRRAGSAPPPTSAPRSRASASSGARPTIPRGRSRSRRSTTAPASARCSRPTSGTGTSPTRPTCCPKRGSSSSAASSRTDDFRAFTHDHALALWGPRLFADTVRGDRHDPSLAAPRPSRPAARRIYYEVTGADDAPAVVLTHGAGGSHAAWFQQVPALADAGYRVVTWDSRGFGLSTFATGRARYRRGGRRPRRDPRRGRRRPRAPRRPVDGRLVGHRVRARAPERVRSLTLSNTVGGLWTDALVAALRHRSSRPRPAPTTAAWACTARSAPSFVTRDPGPRVPLPAAQHVPLAAAGARSHARSTGARVEHAALDALGIPILVITGTDDVLFPAPLVHRQRVAPRRRDHRRDRRRRPLPLLRTPRRVQRRAPYTSPDPPDALRETALALVPRTTVARVCYMVRGFELTL